MRLLAVKMVEDCFDGSVIKEFIFDTPISEPFIKKLGVIGALEYFPEFPRPFFRIEKKDDYQIKGVVQNKTMRVIFNRSCDPDCVTKLAAIIDCMGKELLNG